MSDKLKTLGNIIGKYAPKVGKVIGLAIPGTDFIGEALGHIFGTKDPDKLVEAINQDHQAALKLKELEFNHEAQLNKIIADNEIAIEQEKTKQASNVNETMRAEISSDGWFKSCWRPLFGYLLAINFTIFVNYILYLSYLVVSGKSVAAINMIPTLVSAFTILFGAGFAVVGVTVSSRGAEKLAKMGITKPGMFETIGNILRK